MISRQGGGGSAAIFHTGKPFLEPLYTKFTQHTKILKAYIKTNVFLKLKNANENETEILKQVQNDSIGNVIAGLTRNRRVAAVMRFRIPSHKIRRFRNDGRVGEVFTLAEGATHVANCNSYRKSAFTLAEVLITLGIIGVVAAMTLPTILNKTRNKELHTAFLKTYTELNQIAQMIVANEGISISDSISNNTGCGAMPPETANKIFKYFKGDSSFLTRNGQGTNDGNGNFIPYYKIKTLNGNAYSGGANSAGSDSSFLCDNSGFKSNASGALYILSDPPANGQNGPVICVDINGKKGPNRYGIDYFMFIFTVDGKVIPVGQKHKNNPQVCNSSNGSCCNFNNVGAQYCSNTSNDISKNTSCAYYALTNTHPTKNGKDYWTDFLGEVYSR